MDIPQEMTENQYLTHLMRQCGHFLYHQSRFGQQQDAVVGILRENGSMSQKALQERLAIQPGSVSELVTKLENKGFIARQRDPQDRRRVVLTLTEKGRSANFSHPLRPVDSLYDSLTPEECQSLTAILEKLVVAWKR